jgi:hypothetical protein
VFTVGPCLFRGCINESDRVRSRQLGVVVAAEARKPEDNNKLVEYSKQAVSLRSGEEYKKSDCEDLTCDLKTSCVP